MGKITIYKGRDYQDEELSAWYVDKAKAIEASLETILNNKEYYEELYKEYLEYCDKDEEKLSFRGYFKNCLENTTEGLILEEELYI